MMAGDMFRTPELLQHTDEVAANAGRHDGADEAIGPTSMSCHGLGHDSSTSDSALRELLSSLNNCRAKALKKDSSFEHYRDIALASLSKCRGSAPQNPRARNLEWEAVFSDLFECLEEAQGTGRSQDFDWDAWLSRLDTCCAKACEAAASQPGDLTRSVARMSNISFAFDANEKTSKSGMACDEDWDLLLSSLARAAEYAREPQGMVDSHWDELISSVHRACDERKDVRGERCGERDRLIDSLMKARNEAMDGRSLPDSEWDDLLSKVALFRQKALDSRLVVDLETDGVDDGGRLDGACSSKSSWAWHPSVIGSRNRSVVEGREGSEATDPRDLSNGERDARALIGDERHGGDLDVSSRCTSRPLGSMRLRQSKSALAWGEARPEVRNGIHQRRKSKPGFEIDIAGSARATGGVEAELDAIDYQQGCSSGSRESPHVANGTAAGDVFWTQGSLLDAKDVARHAGRKDGARDARGPPQKSRRRRRGLMWSDACGDDIRKDLARDVGHEFAIEGDAALCRRRDLADNPDGCEARGDYLHDVGAEAAVAADAGKLARRVFAGDRGDVTADASVQRRRGMVASSTNEMSIAAEHATLREHVWMRVGPRAQGDSALAGGRDPDVELVRDTSVRVVDVAPDTFNQDARPVDGATAEFFHLMKSQVASPPPPAVVEQRSSMPGEDHKPRPQQGCDDAPRVRYRVKGRSNKDPSVLRRAGGSISHSAQVLVVSAEGVEASAASSRKRRRPEDFEVLD
eukprot:TRINITY_DN4334_c0_g2_i5.p1 TRINITY_DN4334_c0_g2~~TRINITY_DN4334_c0_g2_i5.p1  ORF type:complete len:795 (-),score=123.41 TRINITY_DN4334_c0_g2_i5:127-2373(-)